MNDIYIVTALIISISPLFMPWYKWFLIGTVAFVSIETLLVINIDSELSSPDFDDSAGAAFVGIIVIIPALIFLICTVIRFIIYLVKKLKKDISNKNHA